MKHIKLNGAEFTTVKAVAAFDSADAVQDALFVHFEDDEFHDGDLIVFGYEMPEDDRDAEIIFNDVSAQESCFFLFDDGIYYGGCYCPEDIKYRKEEDNPMKNYTIMSIEDIEAYTESIIGDTVESIDDDARAIDALGDSLADIEDEDMREDLISIARRYLACEDALRDGGYEGTAAIERVRSAYIELIQRMAEEAAQ